MSVDWLINLKPLRDPVGSQIKLHELKIFLSSSKGKCSSSSPVIGDDLHFCLDLRTGGVDESLHQLPLGSGPDSYPTPSRHGPSFGGPKVWRGCLDLGGQKSRGLNADCTQFTATPRASVSLLRNGDLSELLMLSAYYSFGPRRDAR